MKKRLSNWTNFLNLFILTMGSPNGLLATKYAGKSIELEVPKLV